MADEKRQFDDEQRWGISTWLWTMLWSIFGILLALCVIGMMLVPLIWVGEWFGESAANRSSTATAIAEQNGDTSDGGGNGDQTGGSGAGDTVQTPGSGDGSSATVGSGAQTATAQANGTATSEANRSATQTAQAGDGTTGDGATDSGSTGSGATNGGSTNDGATSGTAQNSATATAEAQSASQTATAQAENGGTDGNNGGTSSNGDGTASGGNNGTSDGSGSDGSSSDGSSSGSNGISGSGTDGDATSGGSGAGDGSGTTGSGTTDDGNGSSSGDGSSGANGQDGDGSGGSNTGSGNNNGSGTGTATSGTPANTPTPTVTPTPTATPIVPQVSTDQEDVDVHTGPSTLYPIVGVLPTQTPVRVIGRNDDDSWWRVEQEDRTAGWVDASRVEEENIDEDVPVVQPPPLPLAPLAPGFSGQGQDYIVQVDDWLSKLSEKFYSSTSAYWPIMAASNTAGAIDSSYTTIVNPDAIEIGDKLIIPPLAEAETFMSEFDPTTGDVSRLFASGDEGQLQVGSWWTVGNEFTAINQVFTIYRAENPEVILIHAGLASGEDFDFEASHPDKLQAGAPFDTFQLPAGAAAGEFDPTRLLTPLTGVLTGTDVVDVIPADLQNRLALDGEIYTLPMYIRRGNVMWSNSQVLAQAGLGPPSTFAEFVTACEALRNQGLTPLALGGRNGTELSHLFETVLAGTLGAQAYQGLWDGSTAWSDPQVTTALANFSQMLDCSNENRADLDWSQALELVVNGQAAFTITGDWAFRAISSQEALDRMTWTASPGNEGQFLLISEGFALPQQAPNPANARNFMTLIAGQEAQQTFNRTNISLCVRTDCDYATFSLTDQLYILEAAFSYENDTITPMVSYGSAVNTEWQAEFIRIVTDFATNRDVSSAQTDLEITASLSGTP